MVGLALAVAGGMLVGAVDLFSFEVLVGLTCVSLAISFFRFHSTGYSPSVFITVSLLAACRFMMAVPDYSILDGQYRTGAIEIVGTVSGSSGFYAYSREDEGTCSFPMNCEGVLVGQSWVRSDGEVEVRVRHIDADFRPDYGARIRVTGRLERRLFPGRSKYELQVSGEEGIDLLNMTVISAPVRWGKRWCESAAGKLEKGMDVFPEELAVLRALVLGFRDELPQEHLNRFKRTGSFHIFAISGLHVGIVGLLLAIVLKVAGVPRDKFAWWLLPLLAMYVISTGMKSSALRALTMAGVFILAPVFRRKPDVPVSIAAAGILLLMWQPMEILSTGFIFSFAVVICIVMVFSKVPQPWVQGVWLKRYTISLIITSFSASLASIPLAALYFGTFSPVSLIGNLIVVPLTFLIVVCGWLAILLPWSAEIFNASSVVFIDLLLGAVERLDALPMSSLPVSVPPTSALLLWFGSLVYLFTHAHTARERRYAAISALCAVVLALLG